jgi:predicted nucleic acid-binding protein
MATVYLETSFISACVTDRRDPGSLYRQSTSLEWWRTQRHQHRLYVSDEVIAELSDPRYSRRQKALDHIEGLESLVVSEEVIGLARILMDHKVMPGPLQGDAVHVAVATVYGMDFVLSWNVRHLANPNKIQHLNTICLRLGLMPPRIITPEFLWEDDHEPSE